MTQRTRSFCLTLNNYTDVEYQELLAVSCRYKVIGKEVGESGTPHLQGYFYFEDKKTLGGLKKINKRAHWEVSRGTPTEASNYCKKDGDFVEQGEIPTQGKRTDLEKIRDEIKEGKPMREIIEKATNYQSLRTAEVLYKYLEKSRDFKTNVVWLWGASGVGKTRYAFDNENKEDIYKINASMIGKWWQGYDAHKIVIIDEVDGMTSYDRLKELCDRYPCMVEYKGGSRQFLAQKIYITSLEDPNELFFTRPEGGREMLRRIDEIIFLQ